ncbi:Hint domain-containing protein [Albidovulum inexpectatum]|uniref:Hint domain-containing protein n=1 Tax=Albidovulum inexpectatum TaxID=196587 RepID=A0A2S5JLT7_9RHOB|nr:Hint domain-containing protein [Albidovulum inexpectatum]
MPTNYLDQFYQLDPAFPPPPGTAVAFVKLTLTDQNDDDDLDRFNGDSLDGIDITRSWPGDTVTINVPGIGNITYTGTTFYLADGRRFFTPTDGQVLRNGTFVSSTYVTTQGPLLVSQLGPPCFTAGTLIDTPAGPVPVEDLRPGDMVMTLDHGARPLHWVGRRTVAGSGKFAPITIEPGIFDNDIPLVVSPEHRILYRG